MPPKVVPAVAAIREYAVASQEVWRSRSRSRMLKLDWNESPAASPQVRKALKRFLDEQGSINWYPDVCALDLSNALARHLSCSISDLLIFPGSDVALETLARTYVSADSKVAIVSPGYEHFRVYLESCAAQVTFVRPGMVATKWDCVHFLQALERIPGLKLIYLINPNNPVGYYIPLDDIHRTARRFPEAAVVVDEAYIEFAAPGGSAVEAIRELDNLFIVRSFSKAFGMAGLRLGYIVSQNGNLRHINKLRNGKNVSMLAQIAGKVLIDNYDLVTRHVERVCAARQWFLEQYRRRGGEAFDSAANFVLVRVHDVEEVLLRFRAQRIFARDRSAMDGLANMIRITIGHLPEMKRVLSCFEGMPRELWASTSPRNEERPVEAKVSMQPRTRLSTP